MIAEKTNKLSEIRNETAKSRDYIPFVPFISKDDIVNVEVRCARLFDDTPEQISHGTAPWDEYGWSRDGWGI
ncbi:MAG: hypothetical protein IKZ98_08305 [Clostridia bacterium]|nr:hypothetical protein [Clostridia bacterium]